MGMAMQRLFRRRIAPGAILLLVWCCAGCSSDKTNPAILGAAGAASEQQNVPASGSTNTGIGGQANAATLTPSTPSAGVSSIGASVPAGLLNPDTTTKWEPGILKDKTGQPLGVDGLPVRTTICQTVAPGQAANLQKILNSCADGTVVQLEAGTYTVPSTIYVPSGVVLRGAGSSGQTATLVALAKGANGPTLAIGPNEIYDQVCYNSNFAKAVALVADAAKEQNQVAIAPNTAGFAAGDLAIIDEQNDSSIVDPGDSDGAFTRSADRILSQRVQIAAIDTKSGTITLSSPLHWNFKTAKQAQLAKASNAVTEWAGIEHIWVQGGKGLGEYLGRKAGGIDLSNSAYCWVKDVQTDGTMTGMHVTLTGTHRCVVRDSHFHNSAKYGFGQDNYGIVLRCGASDNLIENNIARYMNKPILFNNSGGGNVVGYNYADNEWSLDSSSGDQFQEASIDIHCAFPHMELIEGNYAPHIAASITHGNGGYLTYFRNYASSQQAPDPIVWSLPSLPQTGNVAAFQFDDPDHHMTVIGNVLGSTTNASLGVPTSLGTADVSKTYMSHGGDSPAIFALGAANSPSVTTLVAHGNFDTVNGTVIWAPGIALQTLPESLYYAAKPGWWPVGVSWPWVGPDLSPKVATLPAQAAAKSFDYKTSNNPSCSPNLGEYSCP